MFENFISKKEKNDLLFAGVRILKKYVRKGVCNSLFFNGAIEIKKEKNKTKIRRIVSLFRQILFKIYFNEEKNGKNYLKKQYIESKEMQ